MGLRERDSTVEPPIDGIERTAFIARQELKDRSKVAFAHAALNEPLCPKDLSRYDVLKWYDCGCELAVHRVGHVETEFVVIGQSGDCQRHPPPDTTWSYALGTSSPWFVRGAEYPVSNESRKRVLASREQELLP